MEVEEAHSLGDVQRFHILLVPRPPGFAVSNPANSKSGEDEDAMNLITEDSDALPASETINKTKKRFRLIAVGKKQLPDPCAGGGEEGGPACLAARGVYTIVNYHKGSPSSRETHLVYALSHPSPECFGEVQQALGIHQASAFVVQVKNPDAPSTGGAQVGLSATRKAEFSEAIIFGADGFKGRESFGLRFAVVERRDMLEYEGAEVLLIAARSGDEGLETSFRDG